MVPAATRFASKTMGALVDLLLTRRVAVARCAEALRNEAADALGGRDLSDLLDDEDPSVDSDAATVLMLVQRAEGHLWEVDEALGRIANGTYGYCIGCGAGIPLQRLRALPATATCVECGRRSSHRARNLVDREHLRSVRVRGRSLAGFGVSVAGGER
jgi:RNA polymerase-binding transcription factor DksA